MERVKRQEKKKGEDVCVASEKKKRGKGQGNRGGKKREKGEKRGEKREKNRWARGIKWEREEE
jgi:hypothetical protein